MKALLENGADAALCDVENFVESKSISKSRLFDGINGLVPDDVFYKNFAAGNVSAVWNEIFVKNIIINNNIRFENGISVSEDTRFNLSVYRHVKKVAFVSESLYRHRAGTSVSLSGINNRDFKLRWERMHKSYEDYKVFIEEKGFWNECENVANGRLTYLIHLVIYGECKKTISNREKIESFKYLREEVNRYYPNFDFGTAGRKYKFTVSCLIKGKYRPILAYFSINKLRRKFIGLD